MKLVKTVMVRWAAGILVSGAACLLSADDSQNWKIESDNSGQITKMTYANPKTQLNIEKELVYNISPSGKPASGTVNFTNGFSREMKQGEVVTYFDMFNGFKAEWDSWQSQDKLVTVGSDGKIPAEWLGKPARIITNTGKDIIGRLSASDGESEYQIEVDGACCGPIHFTMAGIKQVQELK